ncbi:MAG: hypothetical protein MPK62_13225, partial [Alphaproteobacteria bacterium]|nr:hypothetical protein [Alphaproteobacteria bacterium]
INKEKEAYLKPSRDLFSHLTPAITHFKSLTPINPIIVTYVVPIYKEHHRLRPKSEDNPNGEDLIQVKIKQLEELFSLNPRYTWRLIFIDDGDRKFKSGEIAIQELQRRFRAYFDSEQVKVFFLEDLRVGIAHLSKKGWAVVEAFRYVFSNTKVEDHDLFFYTDADISSDLRLSGSVIYELETGQDLVITSRWEEKSTVINRGLKEKLRSWIYNLVVYYFLKLDYTDTQNGFKGFRANCLKTILPLSKEIGYAFDTELLMLAEVKEFAIKEIPIYWVDSKPETNIRLGKDAFEMFKALKKQAQYKKKIIKQI